jgi:hypothetical protein
MYGDWPSPSLVNLTAAAPLGSPERAELDGIVAEFDQLILELES